MPDHTVAETAPEAADGQAVRRTPSKKFPLRAVAGTLALILLAGVMLYYNVFEDLSVAAESPHVVYTMEVDSRTGTAGVLEFTIRGEEEPPVVIPREGSGTAADPYLLDAPDGVYAVSLTMGEEGTMPVYFSFTVKSEASYTLEQASEDLSLRITYPDAAGERASVFDAAEGTAFTVSPAPEGGSLSHGNKVGDLCYDFTLAEYTTGKTFTLSEHRGKVVVINFWATWCTPCVTELPEFQHMTELYEGVEVVAIHSAMVSEPVQAYLDSKKDTLNSSRVWRDWNVHFVQDTGNDSKSETYDLLGGKGSYPVTLIVDAEGYVRFVRQGSMTAEVLQREIEKCLH